MIHIPKLVVLNLTSDCNMRCQYCYAAAGERYEYMSKMTALRVIDEMIRINQGCQINVLFHGGEPLICYDVLKSVISHCEKNYRNRIKFYIQTNCLLLDEEKIAYFIENNVKISISVDGDNNLSNICRVLPDGENSIEYIKRSIQLLNRYNVNVNALAVLNKYNYKEVNKIIKFFVENNIYLFSFNYFIKGGRGNNSDLALNSNELFETTVKILSTIEKYHNKGIYVIERNTYYLVKMLVTGIKTFMCSSSPCGAGISIIGIAPNGDVFPCDDLSGQEQFKLGNINTTDLDVILDNKIIKYFTLCNLNNIKKCCECEIKNKCGAGCCSRKYYENDDIYCVDPLCEFYKKIIPYVEKQLQSKKIDYSFYKI